MNDPDAALGRMKMNALRVEVLVALATQQPALVAREYAKAKLNQDAATIQMIDEELAFFFKAGAKAGAAREPVLVKGWRQEIVGWLCVFVVGLTVSLLAALSTSSSPMTQAMSAGGLITMALASAVLLANALWLLGRWKRAMRKQGR